MSKTIIIDNYDSFTYNLKQIVNEIQDEEVTVRRNNETTIEEVATFDHIILSPGPGLPEEAGLLFCSCYSPLKFRIPYVLA